MSDIGTPAAPAADLNEADSAALFAEMSAAKFDPKDDPTPAVVKTDEEDGEPVLTPVTPEPTPAAPAADATPAPTPTPAPAAPAPAPAATDIWASATPELRAAHDAELARERQRYNSDIGRQAAYQTKIKSLEDEIAGRTAKPAASAPAAPAATPTSLRDNPAIKKSLEEYPEVVGPLLDALEPVVAENTRLGRELSTLSEDRRLGVIATQEQALDGAHPDWRDACASKDFADWLAVQPNSIKEIVKRNGEQVVDAAEAIAMVGNFKAHYALTHPAPQPVPATPATPAVPAPAAPTNLSERRAAQLAAVTVTPKGAPAAVPSGAPAGDEAAVFNHFVQKKAQKG